MTISICPVIDNQGRRVAEIDVQGVEDDWYYGRLVSDLLPEGLRRDLEWYDEVVSDQMLSFLDDALAAVERHQLSVRQPDEGCRRVYCLHIGKAGEATFRITPIPPREPSHVNVSTMQG